MTTPRTLILATRNQGKVRELRDPLARFGFDVQSLPVDFPEIEENGTTFYENALIKAKAVSDALGVSALADDSGLMVDALNGEPGIYSARYAGDGIDEHNNQLLLKNMQGVADRSAKFVCSLVLYGKEGVIASGYGETEGSILFAEDGKGGFGYDPLFFSNDLGKSFGVASEEEKNGVSHRFRAIQDLLLNLENK